MQSQQVGLYLELMNGKIPLRGLMVYRMRATVPIIDLATAAATIADGYTARAAYVFCRVKQRNTH